MTTTLKSDKEFTLIFIAVFFSSIIGLRVGRIAINKLALIPLEIYLVIKYSHSKNSYIKINRQQKLILIWLVCAIFSSCVGLLSTYSGKYNNFDRNQVLNIIQIFFIYIPITISIEKCNSAYSSFVKSIIITAYIHGVMAIIQFVAWYIFHIDIMDVIFNSFFKGFFGTDWTAFNFEGGKIALRVGGFNRDTAFFSLLLIFAYNYTKNIYSKFFFLICSALSMSRSGILGMVLSVIFDFAKAIRNGKVKTRWLYPIILSVIVVVFICNISPSIRYQLTYLNFRFQSVFNNTDFGTARHLSYLSGAFNTWLLKMNFIEKIFGIGPRSGGVALTEGGLISQSIGHSKDVWTIECDYAEMLLGHGFIGYLIYYIVFRVLKIGSFKEKKLALVLLILSLMYNYFDLTLVILWLICLAEKMNGNKYVKNSSYYR